MLPTRALRCQGQAPLRGPLPVLERCVARSLLSPQCPATATPQRGRRLSPTPSNQEPMRRGGVAARDGCPRTDSRRRFSADLAPQNEERPLVAPAAVAVALGLALARELHGVEVVEAHLGRLERVERGVTEARVVLDGVVADLALGGREDLREVDVSTADDLDPAVARAPVLDVEVLDA